MSLIVVAGVWLFSGVMHHMSLVTFHMSHVIFHIVNLIFIIHNPLRRFGYELPLEPHAYLKIQSINGSCLDLYSFPIVTIVIVFAAVEVIVTVIMVLVPFTNLANLRWLLSC